uniref:hypothetical protein n=1 Tax=Pedobacter schmidteae TaxID=2201271 RepID=UPI000EB24850|nr:hypothetical protein [Pedobacter schmidteae]
MRTLKNLIVLLVIAMLFCAGCFKSEADLNGTYINHAASEFSIADDTLVVEHVSGLDYLIHRKTGYLLLDDAGRPGKRVLEKEEWKAVFDAGSGTMTESSKGRMISFDKDKGVLKLENSLFQRIN